MAARSRLLARVLSQAVRIGSSTFVITCEFAGLRLSFGFVFNMKAEIHPDYQETDMVCACGAVYHTRSTKQDIRIGICAACHPFFTGEQKFVDTAGRVEKFARRYGSTKAARAGKA